jgi:hypothetical protein
VNITAEEWEQKLERDRTRKRPGSRAEIREPSEEYPPGNPIGNPDDFHAGALDKDKEEDSLKREIARERASSRDPLVPISGRRDVVELHEAWKGACGFPNHRFRSGWDPDARTLVEAIDAHGLEDCLLVAKYAPNDGMVNGRKDEHGKKHDTIRYVFGNADAFHRILRDAQNAEGKSHSKSSAHDAIERARAL